MFDAYGARVEVGDAVLYQEQDESCHDVSKLGRIVKIFGKTSAAITIPFEAGQVYCIDEEIILVSGMLHLVKALESEEREYQQHLELQERYKKEAEERNRIEAERRALIQRDSKNVQILVGDWVLFEDDQKHMLEAVVLGVGDTHSNIRTQHDLWSVENKLLKVITEYRTKKQGGTNE